MATPDDLGTISGTERSTMTGRVGLGRLGLGRLGAVSETNAAGVLKTQEQRTPNTPTVWTEFDPT